MSGPRNESPSAAPRKKILTMMLLVVAAVAVTAALARPKKTEGRKYAVAAMAVAPTPEMARNRRRSNDPSNGTPTAASSSLVGVLTESLFIMITASGSGGPEGCKRRALERSMWISMQCCWSGQRPRGLPRVQSHQAVHQGSRSLLGRVPRRRWWAQVCQRADGTAATCGGIGAEAALRIDQVAKQGAGGGC